MLHFQQSRSRPESDLSIHPAVRTLIGGKRPKEKDEKDKERQETEEKEKEAQTEESSSSSLPNEAPSASPLPSVIPGYIPPKPVDTGVRDPRGIHHKFKLRIVVGNVSKWIQCDQREDQATHKWMIYVRGDKEHPDVSDVVAKVRFLIHPSYHPHDLVEVTKAPFHLTRRGWGEFPARVQIHFKDDRDKPVDIIHELKLDKTYTGLQTLGAETNLDVWLHNPSFVPPARSADDSKGEEDKEVAKYKFVETESEGWVIAHSETKSLRPGKEQEDSSGSKAKAESEDTKAVKDQNNVENSSSGLTNGIEPLLNGETDTKLNSPTDYPVANGMSNGSSQNDEQNTTYVRCSDKSGKPFYLPVRMLPNNHQKQVGSVAGQLLGKPQRHPPTNNRQTSNKSNALKNINSCSIRITRIDAPLENGGIKVLPPATRSSSKAMRSHSPSPARSGFSSPQSSPRGSPSPSPVPGVSLLRNPVRPGTSLLKRNVADTDLEKKVPGISLDFWSRILGRSPMDTQNEIENRVAKRGIQHLEKYSELHQFLRFVQPASVGQSSPN